jgi:hypothetical protein
MEKMAQDHPNATTLRLGNVVGADTLFAKPRAHYTLDQFADGATPARSYIGPRLLAEIFQVLTMHRLRERPLSRVLNVATPQPVEMGHLLDAAQRDWSPRPAQNTAIKSVALNCQRLAKVFPLPQDCSSAKALVADYNSVMDAT